MRPYLIIVFCLVSIAIFGKAQKYPKLACNSKQAQLGRPSHVAHAHLNTHSKHSRKLQIIAVTQDGQARHTKHEAGSRISFVLLLGEGFSENANPTAVSLDSRDGGQETIESLEVLSKTGKECFAYLDRRKKARRLRRREGPTLAAPFPAATLWIPTA